MSRQVRVLIDVPEPRPVKGRLAVGADGSTWDYRPGITASDVWIDPCTSTAMLAPLPVTDAWRTTFSGNYARYAYADFTGTDISKWSGFAVSTNTSDTAIRMDQTTANAIVPAKNRHGLPDLLEMPDDPSRLYSTLRHYMHGAGSYAATLATSDATAMEA